jgi:uncharacterized protein YhbP (UPF0306 family)
VIVLQLPLCDLGEVAKVVNLLCYNSIMNLRALIVDYLSSAYFMQVATVKDNQPWVCTVHFVSDDQLNLYWISLPSTRHSQELLTNSKVAGTVVLPHAPDDKVRGIQFQGVAEELNGESARPGLELYAKRYKIGSDWVESMVSATDEHRCYRIKPSMFVLFDQVNFPDHPRREYSL